LTKIVDPDVVETEHVVGVRVRQQNQVDAVNTKLERLRSKVG
jgi:hypothetical protein